MTAADVIAAHARQETPQRTPAKLKTSEIFDARTNFQSRASVHTLPKMEQRQPREHANVIPGHRQMGELQLKDAILDCHHNRLHPGLDMRPGGKSYGRMPAMNKMAREGRFGNTDQDVIDARNRAHTRLLDLFQHDRSEFPSTRQR